MNFIDKLQYRLWIRKIDQNDLDQITLEKIIRNNIESFYKKEIKDRMDLPNIDFSQCLKLFAESKNIDMIPTMFWFLLVRNSEVKKSVVKEITILMKGFDNKQYSYLAKEFRKRTLITYSFDWSAIDMDYLLEDYMTEEEKIAVLGLASFHPDGFMREKALSQLIKYDENKILRFIIIRACDWVSSIRKKAQQILIEIIQVKNISNIVSNMALIHKIKENEEGLKKHYQYYEVHRRKEFFYEEVNTKIEGILNSSENISTVHSSLVENVFNKDKYVQEYVLRKIISNDILSYKEIIAITAKVEDSIIAVKCIRLILEKLSDEEVIDLKADLDEIKGYRANVELIRRLSKAGYFKDSEELKQYALSKYFSVRDIARFYMRKLGFDDFDKFYIENLHDSKNAKNALLGLCETCEKDDMKIIVRYFKDSSSKVQKKILNKIIELSERELCCDYNIFLEALQSGKKSIIKIGRMYIKQNSYLLDREVIYKAYKNESDEFAKESLAEILCNDKGWIGLFYSLKLIGDESKIGRRVGTENIAEWIGVKESYLVKDDATGKIKYYNLSKMNKELAASIKDVMKENGYILEGSTREIIEGLILNYAQRI